ncbi:MAG: dockerin type I domain-containing protein [Thermoanaerobaculia bacterium]|nr:dockerin type I domain-containing protein [Thermoanaerobaculia bacterium]
MRNRLQLHVALLVALLAGSPDLFASDAAYLVKDINSSSRPLGSYPQEFVSLGNISFFSAMPSRYVADLWRTDGSAAGTFYVAPGGYSKVVWNGRLWFLSGDEFAHSSEVWSTDGTVAGTTSFTMPNASAGIPLYPSSLVAGPSGLYVQTQYGIYRTDGTTAGTTLVGAARFRGGSEQLNESWTVLGTSIYFTWYMDATRTTLWKLDANGVSQVYADNLSNGFWWIQAAGSTIYLGRGQTDGYSNWIELWRSDGTTAGTFALTGAAPIKLLGDVSPTVLSEGGRAYFVGSDGTGDKLWRTDGTVAGTVAVAASLPGASTTFSATGLAQLPNGTMLFAGNSLNAEPPATSWGGLWAFDGVSVTFLRNADAFADVNSTSVAADYAVFRAGVEEWRSDGTIGGTYSLGDVAAALPPGVRYSGSLGDRVLFAGYDATYGPELWSTAGSPETTALVKDVAEETYASYPMALVALNGGVVFTAHTEPEDTQYPDVPRQLWFSDGTEAGTISLLATDGGSVEIKQCGGQAYFAHWTAETGTELWATDGTVGGTRMIKDIRTGTDSYGAIGSQPGYFACVDNRLFFLARGPVGSELWRSDGTGVGTLMVKRLGIVPVTSQEFQIETPLLAFDHRVFFFARENYEKWLWVSDGTAAGTRVLKEFTDDPRIGFPRVVGNHFYFSSGYGFPGKIWRSDGTDAGTTVLFAGSHASLIGGLGERLLFRIGRDDPYASSDSCSVGPSGVDKACFDDTIGGSGPWTFGVVPLNGLAYYNVPELRSTDGFTRTTTGVGNVAELFESAGGRLFARGNGVGGTSALIETDGSRAGTRAIYYGHVGEAVASGGRVFIGAHELYAYDLPATAISFAPRQVSTAGGDVVTISGRGFTGPASVVIRGVVVPATVGSAAAITFTAPPSESGAFDVELRLGDGRRMTLDEPLIFACAAPTAVIEPLPSGLPPSSPVPLRGSGGRCAWFPETGLDDASSCTPNALPEVTTTYTLVAISDSGCESTNHPSVFVPDRVGPAGHLTAPRVTRFATTTIRMTATDGEGVVAYLLRSTHSIPSADDPQWVAVTPATSFSGEATDWPLVPGPNTIYAWFKDPEGNVSAAATIDVLFDQSPPVVSIVLNGDAAYTRTRTVVMHVTASDNDVLDSMTASVVPTLPTNQWRYLYSRVSSSEYDETKLLAYGDGPQPLYVWYRDAAGNLSEPATDTIILDTTYPTGTVAINPAGAYTTSPDVTLDLQANDANGITSIYVSNVATYPGSSAPEWIAVDPAVDFAEAGHPWSLEPGDGPKTVTVWYRDIAGNPKAFNASIVLDQNPPAGSIFINGGATHTSNNVVTLSLVATDALGVAAYYISNDATPPAADAAAWVAVGPSTSFSTSLANWTLVTGTQMTVHAWFKDTRGAVSGAVSASITLDQVAPTGSLSIDGGAQYTRLTTGTITLNALDEVVVAGCYVSNDPATPLSGAAGWVAVTPASSYFGQVAGWAFNPGATMTAYAWFKDAAGNVSQRASGSIELDQAPPTAGTLSLTPGAGKIDVSWSGQSDQKSGVASYKLVYASGTTAPADCSGEALATTSPFSHQGLTQSSNYSYRLCTTDVAGNSNAGATASAKTTAKRLKGDINGNGAVSALDASMILQSVVGTIHLDDTQRCAADFNGNGSVSAFDAAMVLQCVVNPSTCSSNICN